MVASTTGLYPSTMTVALRLREKVDADPVRGWAPTDFYDIIVQGEVVGTIQLRLGNTDAMILYGGQVGYGVKPEHRGNGYATVALRALVPIARRHGFEELWITCQPSNIASRRALEKAGAKYVEVLSVPLDSDLYARGDLEMCRYLLNLGG